MSRLIEAMFDIAKVNIKLKKKNRRDIVVPIRSLLLQCHIRVPSLFPYFALFKFHWGIFQEVSIPLTMEQCTYTTPYNRCPEEMLAAIPEHHYTDMPIFMHFMQELHISTLAYLLHVITQNMQKMNSIFFSVHNKISDEPPDVNIEWFTVAWVWTIINWPAGSTAFLTHLMLGGVWKANSSYY